MHLPVIILLAVAAAGALAGVGGTGFLKGPMRVVRALSSGRERVRLLLERVEKEESPEFVMGAMCYAPMHSRRGWSTSARSAVRGPSSRIPKPASSSGTSTP